MRLHLILPIVITLLITGRLWAAPTTRPNVIIVLIDDVGYGDFACLGNPIIKTPNIDRLYGQTAHLTDFHVTPMCTPTRGELMTGVDALRNGAMNVSSGRALLRTKFPTLGNLFKQSGYRTASIGKWHLGDNFPYRPEDRGFDKAIWFPSSHISSAPDFWCNDYFNTHLRTESGAIEQFSGYCTDIFFNEAIKWMGERAAASEPFFLYLPTNAAHAPLFAPDRYRKPYRKLPEKLATFYAMIANVDDNVGKLEAFLNESHLRDNTILIFLTDNGGTVGVKTFNAGMKGGKVSLYEGGHRVPCFIRVPGAAGEKGWTRDIPELTEVQDLLPTLVDLCALRKPANFECDGTSLAALLASDSPARGGTIERLNDRMPVIQFSRMNHAAPDKGDAAVLWQRWRLIVNKNELYDVAADPGEEHNVAADHREIAQKMSARYDDWWSRVGPHVNELSNITIGSDEEPESLLSPADWQDVFLDQQLQVRNGTPRNGAWGINVAKTGKYTIELRRWPREADLAIRAPAPEFKTVDGSYPAGKALPIARARLQTANQNLEQNVSGDAKQITFTVTLAAGPQKLQSWFLDQDGHELAGAYYVYVRGGG